MTGRFTLLAAACLLAAAPVSLADKDDAFRIDKRDFKKQFKVIALAPPEADDYLQMPDSAGAILEREITAHLQKRGYTVIPSSVLAGIRKEMEAQVGGFEDPETGQVDYAKKQAVREHAFRELWFRETFDAMATIRVSMTQVTMESDQVEWDGAKQKIEHEGRSKKYSANATVSSVSFAVYDSRDNPLYLNFGGLESLVQRANGQIVALDVDKLFRNEERIREAAEIAVDPI